MKTNTNAQMAARVPNAAVLFSFRAPKTGDSTWQRNLVQHNATRNSKTMHCITSVVLPGHCSFRVPKSREPSWQPNVVQHNATRNSKTMNCNTSAVRPGHSQITEKKHKNAQQCTKIRRNYGANPISAVIGPRPSRPRPTVYNRRTVEALKAAACAHRPASSHVR